MPSEDPQSLVDGDMRHERREKIERYVKLSALEIFFTNLAYVLDEDDVSGIPVDDLVPKMDEEQLFETLWPADDYPEPDESEEYVIASARSELLTARMFATVAERVYVCSEKANYFRDLAAHHLGEMSEPKSSRRGCVSTSTAVP